ncbi:serine protease snake-like [Homalodisca vitripennis]|uniref:serine protease snake-like n=1 Tax=Homalodisca vitripennis TaxID=197043 RepID=UPI001EEAF1E2|nr:serine protease snake-like [Homalodisca vitripennis]
MIVGVLLIFIFPSLQLCWTYTIDIYKCMVPNGVKGFCRTERECFGYKGPIITQDCPNGTFCCPDSGISKRKCEEYSAAVFGTLEDQLNTEVYDDNFESNCNIEGVPLIVGGVEAALKEFPHMAALGFGLTPNTAKWLCGGTLISEHFVLTAAHCLDHFSVGRPKFVKLGMVNVLRDYSKNVQIHKIDKTIFYPYYNKTVKMNDIGLIKLEGKVQFNTYALPACLDSEGIIKEARAIATGWGKTRNDVREGSATLLKVTLNIIGINDCKVAFSRKRRYGELDETRMCAGDLKGGKDTCQGDSGGPIQTILEHPFCMYRIVGVTSFGLTCGFQFAPAIYTRVFHFIPWIEHMVWSD